eukprot:INCI791.1.p1 GENE.INCI791.1~~INCI791.1.p1  ORF type:complete len:798 (+),score=136.24 INCI791.1:221-2614(+)
MHARTKSQRPEHVVQIHWQNSPSSPSDPSEQYQHAHDIEDLIHERCGEGTFVRMCDPNSEQDRLLKADCTVTVIVLAVGDTKLAKDNAAIVNSLLNKRKFVFLVLKGLTDGNITRFGFAWEHSNDVVVYDLDAFPKAPQPGESIFDVLSYQVAGKLKAVFNDYPVDNFAILLQQRRSAELKQAERSWTLLLVSLVAMILLAVIFMLVAQVALAEKDVEIAELANTTAEANVVSKVVSSQLAVLEEQYFILSRLKEERTFYSESLIDDQIALLLGIATLELSQWEFEAEQYFMANRVAEVNATLAAMCDIVGAVLSSEGSQSDSVGQWARFVSYCENLHILSSCDAATQGDGTCNGGNNYHDCGWDGGDCCPGQYCIDGTHVCNSNFWHHLDVRGSCSQVDADGLVPACHEQFGFYSYEVSSDGVNRYTPSCTEGREATELVFIANIPPGGLVEIRVEVDDPEVPIFLEVYIVDDAFGGTCPVEGGGLSAGTGPNFRRCVNSRYALIQGDANATDLQHAFIIVDVEDITPQNMTIMYRNATAEEESSDTASLWARAQRCEIGHNMGLVGDGTCHAMYDTASCDWDGGDCRCVFGRPSTESFGDGTCDVRFINVWTNTRSCGWDGGDCAVGTGFDDGDGETMSNFDKAYFDNAEINDTYTVLPAGSAPEVLNISRHNKEPGAPDEVITLVALARCQEPTAWICPHSWYNSKNYISFAEYYDLELVGATGKKCPGSPALLMEVEAHRGICDCGCGAVDPDCGENGECENFANIDPLSQRFDPDAPETPVPDTCLCVAEQG